MTESELVHAIRLQFSQGDTRLFRNTVGEAWMGEAKVLPDGSVHLMRARRVRVGLGVGTSDLVGWHTVKGVAVFTGLEAKRLRGKPTTEQRAFIDTVLEAGGIAGVVRSLADCHKLLGY